MKEDKVLNVAIVGGGPGCKAIMDMIFAEKLSQLQMKLIGVACTNPKAVGYRYAKKKKIYTTRDYRDLYKLKNLNMIIELTGREEVADEIFRTKPEGVRLMGNVAARLFWDIFQIQEERIAERKQAEAALAAERERLDVTLRSIGDGVIATDKEGRIVLVNKVAEELTGWTREEAIGKPLTEVFNIINEKTRQPCENPVQRVIETGGIVGLGNHTVLIARDGTERILSDSGAPIRDMDGNVIGVVLVFRDVTETRKLETQLRQAQKMEAIGTLSGGIAHDFNNLLMGIQGRTSLMSLDIDHTHPNLEHLKGIEDLVKRGADLTQQLLGFARGGKYEVKPTDLNEFIQNSSEMFGRTKKEIRIHRKYQKKIWRVEVDRGQIEQVLLNLYVNAWQAMPGGGDLYLQTKNITLDENYVKPYNRQPGRYVKISVTDTGAGMDEATQHRIFDPFFTTKEGDWGTGLGLASAYGIIKNHGGIINVYSKKGHGSTFNIYLPAAEAAVTEEESVVREEEIRRGSETILFVDDEQSIIDVAKDLLSNLGYKVLLASGGEEALDIYKTNKDRIDMVILDMIMPGMGGGEVYDRMKEINPNVKVLLSSGYSINGQATEILKRGCDGFIQKPFNLKQLSQSIRKILLGNSEDIPSK